MTTQRRWVKLAALSLVGILLLLFPLVDNPVYLSTYIVMMQGVIMVQGLRLIMMTGRFSMGHAAFMATGAYVSGLLAFRLGISPWLGLVAGSVAAGFLGLILGSIVLRVSGVYFSILTLGMGELVTQIVMWARPVTGGASGFGKVASFSLAGFDFWEYRSLYAYLALAVTVIAVGVMYRLERSRVGLTLRVMSEHNDLAEHIGINVMKYRMLGFTVACFFAGAAGSLFVHSVRYARPEDFDSMKSFEMIIYAIVGGVASPIGPLLGVGFLTLMSEAFRSAAQHFLVIYGAILVLVTLLLPNGLASLPQKFRRSSGRGAIGAPGSLEIQARVSPDGGGPIVEQVANKIAGGR